ncbi:TIGR02588 family protein [Calothrix sp. UHCC 0171]|uniref:TIGR02588 family protein n=1 Tax=Calothrix sp. UHCC 0171 TaxID=3110245 RepID=UPI002B21FDD2|nr:TIGR02588 family protein [Calothrix sp. UHCC 0171]MEA5574240.1 TIGR02588 family protein [Calothrix sp. UHCC 0171]
MAISQETENNELKQQTKRTLAEWVSFSIASLILALIISLIIYIAINDKQEPPFISIIQKQINRKSNGHYYVPFEIVNKGDITAESVQILAELKINDKVEETGEQQIDFLSSGEKEEGTFIFTNDPRQGQLKIRVASYKSP